MKIFRPSFPQMFLAVATFVAVALLAAGSAGAQQPAPQQGGLRYDVTNYRIEAQLIPEQHMLRAGADITLVPLEATRSLVFELNGSLKVESIEHNGKALIGFVQDAVGVGSLGPSVRVDLGAVVPANQPLTLRFRWSGALQSPEGGPLATRRLAYVGPEGSYLMYASRWFPFHDYAADRATSDITLVVPAGLQVAGTSDDPVTAQPSPKDGTARFRFVHRQPVLVGKLCRRTIHHPQSPIRELRNPIFCQAGQRGPHQRLCREDGPRDGVLRQTIWRTAFGKSSCGGPG